MSHQCSLSSTDRPVLVLEDASKGDLSQFLTEPRYANDNMRAKHKVLDNFVQQILSGAVFLEECNVGKQPLMPLMKNTVTPLII